VCDLLGRHWQRLSEVHDTGLRADEWLEGLLDVAKLRAGEPAVRRLLFGIAVIAAPGLAGLAVDLLRHTSAGPDDGEPAWLAVLPTITASAEVLLLRDGYGPRFGVLTQVTGPGGQPRTYLYDVDLCHGFYQVLSSATTLTPPRRRPPGVTLSAPAPPTPSPGPPPASCCPNVLPGGGVIDGLFGQPLTASHFTELYRGDRIVFAISDALEAAGRPITWPRGDPQQAADLAAALTERFKVWADGNDVTLPPSDGPDDDVVTWLLHDWVSPGMTEELALACSPHRIATFTAYLNDDWRDDHRTLALQVLHPWIRFCLEHNPLGRQAEAEALAWAERAARERPKPWPTSPTPSTAPSTRPPSPGHPYPPTPAPTDPTDPAIPARDTGEPDRRGAAPLPPTTTIDEVLEAFLADQRERLSARTLRNYEDVIGLLRLCLNGYGPNALDEPDRKRWEKAYQDDEGAFCHLFGPEYIMSEVNEFLGYFMVRKVMAGQDLLRSAGTVTKKLANWLHEHGYAGETA
jgi:hypothetical protein